MEVSKKAPSFDTWVKVIDLNNQIQKIDEAQDFFPLSRHNSAREDKRASLEKERQKLISGIFEKN